MLDIHDQKIQQQTKSNKITRENQYKIKIVENVKIKIVKKICSNKKNFEHTFCNKLRLQP